MKRRPPRSTLFPYTTRFRALLSPVSQTFAAARRHADPGAPPAPVAQRGGHGGVSGGQSSASPHRGVLRGRLDRKSTRLNTSHANISYAVFCLKKTTHLSTPL